MRRGLERDNLIPRTTGDSVASIVEGDSPLAECPQCKHMPLLASTVRCEAHSLVSETESNKGPSSMEDDLPCDSRHGYFFLYVHTLSERRKSGLFLYT